MYCGLDTHCWLCNTLPVRTFRFRVQVLFATIFSWIAFYFSLCCDGYLMLISPIILPRLLLILLYLSLYLLILPLRHPLPFSLCYSASSSGHFSSEASLISYSVSSPPSPRPSRLMARFLVEGLNPLCPYQLRVRAMNSVGAGIFSSLSPFFVTLKARMGFTPSSFSLFVAWVLGCLFSLFWALSFLSCFHLCSFLFLLWLIAFLPITHAFFFFPSLPFSFPTCCCSSLLAIILFVSICFWVFVYLHFFCCLLVCLASHFSSLLICAGFFSSCFPRLCHTISSGPSRPSAPSLLASLHLQWSYPAVHACVLSSASSSSSCTSCSSSSSAQLTSLASSSPDPSLVFVLLLKPCQYVEMTAQNGTVEARVCSSSRFWLLLSLFALFPSIVLSQFIPVYRGPRQSFCVRNLIPGCMFLFRVQAVNDVGIGQLSRFCYFHYASCWLLEGSFEEEKRRGKKERKKRNVKINVQRKAWIFRSRYGTYQRKMDAGEKEWKNRKDKTHL